MERLLIDFSCESPEIDEVQNENETISELVLRLAVEKATHIAAKHNEGLIIASDQAAECESQVLGKPNNHENAKRQLMQMSGKTINFYTGLCVFNANTKISEKDTIVYSVTFRQLSEKEIDDYLFKEQPFHCAGSFKSEQLGVSLVSKMSGDDPSALIGLPLIRLCEMLRKQGVNLP